jgi:CheY-like chemotaxis protein
MESSEGLQRTVLIVDDEEPIRRMLERLLGMHAFGAVAVATIATIAEGIAAAEQRRFDAAILDLSLGELGSGLDFLAWLRQHPGTADIPVLILTGRTHLGEDDEALIRRHKAYVFYKPQPVSVLVEYLGRLL